MVLESKTFDALLAQAEQLAQEYANLKEKHSALKAKYNERCRKCEEELAEHAVSSPFLLFFSRLKPANVSNCLSTKS